MSLLSKVFSKLSLTGVRSIHLSPAAFIQTTPILCAEPLKKKKKIDPQVLKQREERRRKKIEKQIRRLEKNSRQLKPIDELEVPLTLIDQKKIRTRKIDTATQQEIANKRISLEKVWSNYKMEQKLSDFKLIDKIILSQQKALSELRFESEELYQEAIQPDLYFKQFTVTGPVSTPPIEKYESPDGEYIDLSKKFE